MIGWELPTSLTIGNAEYSIRSDFRAVLDILSAFNDKELPEEGKIGVMIEILYEDYQSIAPELMGEAAKQAMWFIDAGTEKDNRPKPKTMDWDKDAGIIFPAINKIASCQVRTCQYMHWWDFIGYFNEIEDGLFSQVLSIRQKKATHKKLEKWEQEFYKENKTLCDLVEENYVRPEEEKEAIRKLFGLKK